MVLVQERIEERALARGSIGAGTFTDDQGQQRPSRLRVTGACAAARPSCGSRLCRMRLEGVVRRGGKFNPASLLQLKQQGAGGHVLELAEPRCASSINVANSSTQPPTAPIRMLRQ